MSLATIDVDAAVRPARVGRARDGGDQPPEQEGEECGHADERQEQAHAARPPRSGDEGTHAKRTAGGLFGESKDGDAFASNGPRHSFICPAARRANRFAGAAYAARRPGRARRTRCEERPRGAEEALRPGAIRVGHAQLAAGRDEPREQAQRRFDVGAACRARRRPARGRTARARRAASPCSAQSAQATSPSTSLSASTCAANATASVAPSVASTRAPARAATTLGSASPQPSSITRVPGAGGSSLSAPASADAARPRPRPVRHRPPGAALLVAQLFPIGRADEVGVTDPTHADVQQRRRQLLGRAAAQARELFRERGLEREQRVGRWHYTS